MAIVEANLTDDMKNFQEVMEVITLLKDQDLLNNRVLRAVADFAKHVNQMTPSEISFFTQVFTSDEMQTATNTSGSLA